MTLDSKASPDLDSTNVADGRRIARNSILNIVGVAIPAAMAIIATPILLRHLGPEGFGIFSIQLAVLVLIGVNDFGISRAVILEAVARGGFSSPEELKKVVWSGIELIFAVAIIVFGIAAITLLIASNLIIMSHEEKISWALLLPAAAISLVTLPMRAALEVQERFGVANLLRIGGSSLLFAAPAAATFFEPSMIATSLGMLLSRILLSVASAIATRRLLSSPNWLAFRIALGGFARRRCNSLHLSLIQRGGWLGAAGVASMFIGYTDRFALGLLVSAAAISQYVVPAELVTKMWLVTGALTGAITPRLAHYWAQDNGTKFRIFFIGLSATHVAISLISFIIFVFFGDVLMRVWLSEQYHPAMASLLSVLAVGIAVNGISSANYLLLVLHRKERSIANLQFLMLPLTLAASIIGAALYGTIGVAWVFSGRLIIDAFIIRMIIPNDGAKINSGVPQMVILAWVIIVLILYFYAQTIEVISSESIGGFLSL